MTKQEVAKLILAFIGDEGECGSWDWDDFTSAPQRDPEVETLRKHISRIHKDFPPTKSNEYCSDEGVQALRSIAHSIKS